MTRAADSDVPTWLCDYRHDGPQPLAEWLFVGESGDYAVCDEHFQMRTEEGKRNWHRITSAPDEVNEEQP